MSKTNKEENTKPCDIGGVSKRYEVSAMKLANWETVAIIDNKTDKVICHFNTDIGYEIAESIAEKFVNILNGC